MKRWNAVPLALLAMFLASPSGPLFSQSPPLDPAVRTTLDQGKKFEHDYDLGSALDSDRKALKLAKGKCAECLETIANLQLKMEAPKDAASSAATWASQSSTPAEKARAEYLQASALLAEDHEKHSDSLLTQADQLLRRAAVDDPSNPAIQLLDGHVLAMLKKDAEAKEQFIACAANPSSTPSECLRAKNFASDLTLARAEPAPSFKVIKPDGTTVSLDSLAGKVVLIDFWATWCPACVKDVDYIQSLAEGADEDKWKHYMAENRMIGQQIRDTNHSISDLFHVSAIPTYVILDANGTIQMRVTGTEGDLKGKVRSLLAKTPLQTASLPPN
jgi:thiol-disulfide isomerase/thioredoxin